MPYSRGDRVTIIATESIAVVLGDWKWKGKKRYLVRSEETGLALHVTKNEIKPLEIVKWQRKQKQE